MAATVQGALMIATEATLKALLLPGIDADRWFRRKQLWDVKLAQLVPCGIIAPASKGVDWNAGSTDTDEISYGVAIALVAAGNMDLTLDNGIYFQWSEAIIRRFLNRRDFGQVLPVAGDQLIRTNVVPPSDTFLEQAKRAGWDAQYVLLRFVVEEIRE